MMRRFAPLALFLIVVPLLGAVVLVGTSERWLEPWMQLGLAPSIACFLLASSFLAGFSLVPTHAASLVAGMLFGAAGGSLLALVGIALGAVVSFSILRRLSGTRALELLANRPRARAVHRALLHGGSRRSVTLIALVRLSPIMPFAGTNLVLAASGIRLREFLLGSVVGLAPRIVAVAVAGAGLARLDLAQGADARLAVLGTAATLAALFLISAIARRALRQVIA